MRKTTQHADEQEEVRNTTKPSATNTVKMGPTAWQCSPLMGGFARHATFTSRMDTANMGTHASSTIQKTKQYSRK